jgi:hypothetical protein
MTDQTPVDQTIPQQQVDWEARYKGQVPLIERLTLDGRSKESQLVQLASEVEQLKAQLNLKETEKTASVSERDRQIQEIIQAKTTLESELKRLKALEAKVQVAKELKHPELLTVIDTIPSVEDPEALKTIMSNLVDWGENIRRQEQERILSGITPQTSSVPQTAATPASVDEWQRYISEAEVGSKEKLRRMEEFRNWGMASTKR